MANEQIINILIKMRADIDAAVGKVNSQFDKLDTRSKGIVGSFRSALAPMTMFIRTIMRVGFIWGATIGGMAKLISDLNKEIKLLDSQASQLGISTEELSKKMYGFNIATGNARIGGAQLNTIWSNVVRGFTWVKQKLSEGVGEFAVVNRAQELAGSHPRDWEAYMGKAREQLENEQRLRLEGSKEAVKLQVETQKEINKLTMSQVDFQEQQFTNMLKDLEDNGVEVWRIEQLKAAHITQVQEDLNNEYKRQLAVRYKAEGDTIEAIKLEQDIAYTEYIRKWGKDGGAVSAFKQGQEAILRSTQMSRLGFEKWSDYVDNQLSGTIGAMKTTMADFFEDAFTGNLKKAREYFAEWGRSILRAFANMIAEMIARWVLFGSLTGQAGNPNNWMTWAGLVSSIGGLTGGGSKSGQIQGGKGGTTTQTSQFGETWSPSPSAYHRGGIIRAHSGLAVDEVPIIAQSGERVLSRQQNREYEKGMQRGVVININPIIQLWDITDIERNNRALVSAVSQAITNNSQIRKIIKEYT